VLRGNQPPGTFRKAILSTSLPGYEGHKTIQITYTIPSGIQTVSFHHGFIKRLLCIHFSITDVPVSFGIMLITF